jgi:hypothetical protein
VFISAFISNPRHYFTVSAASINVSINFGSPANI